MKLLAGMASLLRQISLFDAPEAESEKTAPRLPGPASPAPEPSHGMDAIRSRTSAFPRVASHPETGKLPQDPFAPLLRGPYSRIEVVAKPRLHESWRVSWIRRREALRLEIPSLLAEAPEEIKIALLDWALLASRRGRKDKAERQRRSGLEQAIRQALKATGDSQAARRRAARDARRIARLNPKGLFHDLEPVFADINAEYFGGTLEARITWSARLGGLSTHSIAQDDQGRPYHLLSISRGYDDPEATRAILGGVVYHECLHIAIPPRIIGGRRVVHGADFRARERQYAHFEVWRKWHREGLPKALRRARRRSGPN